MASLVAPQSVDPTADAEAIRKAVEGWGSDEKTIIFLIAHRNASQRAQIKEAYQQLYNEDLLHRFEKEFHRHFERSVYLWMLDTWDRAAVVANGALNDKNYHVIVELACVYSPEELFAIRRAYQLRYQHSLEEDVACHTTGDIRKLLLLLVSAYRYESEVTNAKLAEAEAEILHKAIDDKAYNDDELIRILVTRSRPQLVATFYRFEDAYGDSISKKLTEADDELLVKLLNTAIRCIKQSKEYFEEILSDAIDKDNEDVLSRVIVARAEIDLADIKELYYQRKSVGLDHSIDKHFHGDYKRFLLALLGSEE